MSIYGNYVTESNLFKNGLLLEVDNFEKICESIDCLKENGIISEGINIVAKAKEIFIKIKDGIIKVINWLKDKITAIWHNFLEKIGKKKDLNEDLKELEHATDSSYENKTLSIEDKSTKHESYVIETLSSEELEGWLNSRVPVMNYSKYCNLLPSIDFLKDRKTYKNDETSMEFWKGNISFEDYYKKSVRGGGENDTIGMSRREFIQKYGDPKKFINYMKIDLANLNSTIRDLEVRVNEIQNRIESLDRITDDEASKMKSINDLLTLSDSARERNNDKTHEAIKLKTLTIILNSYKFIYSKQTAIMKDYTAKYIQCEEFMNKMKAA